MLNQTLGELLPIAIGVALSPVPIIAVILMLGTPRAKVTGSAFAAGWVLGLVIVSAIALGLTSGADEADSGPSTTVSALQLVFGLLFFALAAKQWQGRPKKGEEAAMPSWMSTIDGFSAGKSFVFGALLSGVNPKNLALTIAAAATISQAGLTGSDRVVADLFFVLIGSVTVVGPVLFYLVASSKATAPLASIKQFMSDNVAVIMMVVLAILGAKLVGNGFSGLTD